MKADRARPKADFLASTDTWFRPASLATGPNGALYVADMYRLWVEHPKFMPPEIAQRIDWRAGDDRGRIWRIVPETVVSAAAKFEPAMTSKQRVALLSDANGWRRQLGQRLIVESQDLSVLPWLRDVLETGPSEFARLHALWTVDGLNRLTPEDLEVALRDPSAVVRGHAVALSATKLDQSEPVFAILSQLADDQDPWVRFQVALALGESSRAETINLLVRIAARDGSDPWFTTAIMTSVGERSAAVATQLLQQAGIGFEHRDLLRSLASTAGQRGAVGELKLLFESVAGLSQPNPALASGSTAIDWRPLTLLTGMADGLVRHRGKMGRTSLTNLLSAPPAEISGSLDGAKQLIQLAASIAVDDTCPLDARLAAIELAKWGELDFVEQLPLLLSFDQPVEIQLAVVEGMDANPDDGMIELLIDRWPMLGPRVRPAAMNILLRRSDSTLKTLKAIEAGKMSAGMIEIDRRVRLLRHHDSAIRSLAEKLLGGAVSSDRKQVANRYRKALTLAGSREAGKAIFAASCAKCHQLNGAGQAVGPDISDVRNRSREALLYEILDPNQKIEPQFTAYLAQTVDGRVFSGLLVEETTPAIVLKLADGKTQTIPRDEIEQFQASGKSLMPEGMEKEISIQQMADLLEFLK